MDKSAFGMLAAFKSPEALVDAARRARRAGYRDLDAFTPFPVPELAEILQLRDRRVIWLGLAGGISGFLLALAMQVFTNFDYPINVGGRPLYPLSAFAVVAFELTVLFAAAFPTIGMFALNGLPRLSHPVFAAPHFHLASRDRFFLCVGAGDPDFDPAKTRAFLETLEPESVDLVSS